MAWRVDLLRGLLSGLGFGRGPRKIQRFRGGLFRFGAWGLGFREWGSWIEVQRSEFGVQGSGF